MEVARRDTLEKQVMQVVDLDEKVEHLLQAIQDNLFQKALAMQEAGTRAVDTYAEFQEGAGEGAGSCYGPLGRYARDRGTDKNETKATIRCIPLDGDTTPGTCMVTGRPSAPGVVRQGLLTCPTRRTSSVISWTCSDEGA